MAMGTLGAGSGFVTNGTGVVYNQQYQKVPNGGFAYPSIPPQTFPNQTSAAINQAASMQVIQTTPTPSGVIVTVPFTDGNGTVWALPIDQAYINLFHQMSYVHQSRLYGTGVLGGVQVQVKPYNKPSMVEGEFSMEEMEKAYEIMEGLDESKGQEA